MGIGVLIVAIGLIYKKKNAIHKMATEYFDKYKNKIKINPFKHR